jgi:hypothetical protein
MLFPGVHEVLQGSSCLPKRTRAASSRRFKFIAGGSVHGPLGAARAPAVALPQPRAWPGWCRTMLSGRLSGRTMLSGPSPLSPLPFPTPFPSPSRLLKFDGLSSQALWADYLLRQHCLCFCPKKQLYYNNCVDLWHQ